MIAIQKAIDLQAEERFSCVFETETCLPVEPIQRYLNYCRKRQLAGLVIAHFCGDLNEATKQALEDKYSGEHDSLADYAEELSEDSVGDIPDFIARYIDYEKMGIRYGTWWRSVYPDD